MNTETSLQLIGKMPPHDAELEVAVLGSLILDNSFIDQVLPFLPEDVFYKEPHRVVFQAMLKLYAQRLPIDILTITVQLKKDNNIDTAGGAFAVSQLTNRVAGGGQVEEYVLFLKQFWMGRKAIQVSSQAIKKCYDPTADIFDTLAFMKQGQDDIDQVIIQNRRTPSFANLVDQAGINLEARIDQEKKGTISGIPTGLNELNAFMGGWQNEDLIVLGGRPSMGKTAIAIHFAKSAAMRGHHINYFSLEMSGISLVDRVILSETNIHAGRYRIGKMFPEDMKAFTDAQERIKTLPFHIFDTPGQNMEFITAQARVKKRKGECQMIIIDYLQLMDVAKKEKFSNREQEVAQISKSCKRLGRELKVPVLLLCQLSREVDKRGGSKKPQLSDLRESGAIEQDADIVMFPYRPEYYGLTEDGNGLSTDHLGELLIAKGRNYGTKDIGFRYNTNITRFWDINSVDPLNTRTYGTNEQDLPF